MTFEEYSKKNQRLVQRYNSKVDELQRHLGKKNMNDYRNCERELAQLELDIEKLNESYAGK